MFEIWGKVNTAICYAKVLEVEAIEQIRRMCDYEFTEGSQIRIMPDVHAGKGCTIGIETTGRFVSKGFAGSVWICNTASNLQVATWSGHANNR